VATTESGILSRIGELVDQEKQLRNRHRATPLDQREQNQLNQIEVELDQCWDLLNQRRALQEYDMDPDEARVRDAETVERYEQ
jgi:Protein of unknown function (DUF2630)